MTTLAWVVGAGGLLGAHVARAVAVAGGNELTLWRPPARLAWSDAATLDAQLAATVDELAAAARATQRRWLVLWCAGAGVVGSASAALEAEQTTWRRFLAH